MVPPDSVLSWVFRLSDPTFDVQEEGYDRPLETDHYKSPHVFQRDRGPYLPAHRIDRVHEQDQMISLRLTVRDFADQLRFSQPCRSKEHSLYDSLFPR